MNYKIYIIKRVIEDLIILPLIYVGKLTARFSCWINWDEEYEIVFFFPFYHVGGAERVHYRISQALRGRKALIIFTKKSSNNAFLDEFIKSGHRILDVSKRTDDKYRYWWNIVYRGVIAHHVNSQFNRPVLFNGQSNFGYKISRWIDSDVYQIELLHTFCDFSYIRIPYIKFYRKSIMISQRRILDHLALYRAYSVPEHFVERIIFIPNGIPLPRDRPKSRKYSGGVFNFLYVGRGTAEKRPEWAIKLAVESANAGLDIKLRFVGDVEAAIPTHYRVHAEFLGDVRDEGELHRLYTEYCDFLILTSNQEGFPLVVMEAMSIGAVIIATPVGDIPLQVMNGVNGLVFRDEDAFDEQVVDMVRFLQQFKDEPSRFMRFSENNIEKAFGSYGIDSFNESYNAIFDSIKNGNEHV